MELKTAITSAAGASRDPSPWCMPASQCALQVGVCRGGSGPIEATYSNETFFSLTSPELFPGGREERVGVTAVSPETANDGQALFTDSIFFSYRAAALFGELIVAAESTVQLKLLEMQLDS